MEEKYKELSNKYKISAKTYFYVLGLATCQTTKPQYLNTSTEIAHAEKTEKTWKLACDILELLADKGYAQNPQWKNFVKKEEKRKAQVCQK